LDREKEEVMIPVHLMEHHKGLPLPSYATPRSSGMDLHAAVEEPVTIPPGGRALIPTGIRISLPPDMEAQVRPRSGLALNQGVTILNAPGTIDSDYRGEIKVILVNLGSSPFCVRRGDRIAQLVFQRVLRVRFTPTDVLDDTERQGGGFGHSGL
jgi:dUTP pyrophosphatase